MRRNKSIDRSSELAAAANGLLDRRALLGAGAALAAGIGSAALPGEAAAQALPVEPWMKAPGAGFIGYGQPSKHEAKVARGLTPAPGMTEIGTSRTPHHLL